ncbi:hypothetical protein ABZ468_07630 [Streptomyces sp. NPDC005708]|uniref:hypothetical protein n=1 Tax=Streptomyces sp. NPDC005708 TaxID=3154564 RepID=UPI0033EB3F55
MTALDVSPAPAATLAVTLARQVAELLPRRAGEPWTVEPYAAWWTTKPAARLAQGDRALILVAHPWRTELAWQLPDREPYEPDLRLERISAAPIAREVLRLLLPVVDDERAARPAGKGAPRSLERLRLLDEIGHAMRLQGMATYNRVGLLRDSSTLVWGTPAGLRYSVTLHGSNPVADVQIQGPVRALERALGQFLPEPPAQSPREYVRGRVTGRLQRRLAAYLTQFTDAEQIDEGGLSFGSGKGPYGYAAPAADPAARIRDTSLAAVDLHGVGVDLLLSRAADLAR